MDNHKRAVLLLDVDNTLVDRDRAFLGFWQDFISRHPAVFLGEDSCSLIREINLLDNRGRTPRELFCRQLLQRFPSLPYTPETLWLDHKKLPEFVVEDTRVIKLLESLRHDFHLVVVSNGSGGMQRRKLKQAGIEPFFSHVLISGEIGFAKPDLSFYRHALSFYPDQPTVMAGDDYFNDIQPALELGLNTIFVNQENIPTAQKPDAVIPNILALEEALNCII